MIATSSALSIPVQTAPASALYVPDETKPQAVLVDVDGTVALRGERGPFEFDRVGEDTPNSPVIDVVRAMWVCGFQVLYCSGRPESCRDLTATWLAKHVEIEGPLFMRPDGDYRPDNIVKLELFDQNVRDFYKVVVALDDRRRVIEAYRSIGLTVLAVADGDF